MYIKVPRSLVIKAFNLGNVFVQTWPMCVPVVRLAELRTMTFDDNAFAITSAIPRAAAIPMYNDERGTDAKNTFKTGFGGRSRLSFRQSIDFWVTQK
jgi:hypothetical protein